MTTTQPPPGFTDAHRAELEAFLQTCPPDTTSRIRTLAVALVARGCSLREVGERCHYLPNSVENICRRYLSLGLDAIRFKGVDHVPVRKTKEIVPIPPEAKVECRNRRLDGSWHGRTGINAFFKWLRDSGINASYFGAAKVWGECEPERPPQVPRPRGRPAKHQKAAKTRSLNRAKRERVAPSQTPEIKPEQPKRPQPTLTLDSFTEAQRNDFKKLFAEGQFATAGDVQRHMGVSEMVACYFWGKRFAN